MLSVIIPAFNEEKYIGACLDAFTRQTTREPFEIILVDNQSTDRTRTIAETFLTRIPLRILSEDQHRRGAVRQTGFAAAKGDILFSVDADTIVSPEWLEAGRLCFGNDQKIAALCGSFTVNDCGRFKNFLLNLTVPLFFVYINFLFVRDPGLCGANFAIRKNIYDRAGGFDRAADAYEDIDLANKVRRFGCIGYCRQMNVIFSGRRFQSGIVRGWIQYLGLYIRKFIFRKKEVTISNVR